MKEVRNADGESWPWEMKENDTEAEKSGKGGQEKNEKGEEGNFCPLNIN